MIDGIMSAIGDGLHQPSMKWRLADLDGEKRLLNARLSDGKEPSPVRVHPNLAEAYRRRVSELEILLEDPELRDEAVEAIGSLIEVVLIHPIEGGYEIELMGEIANMVELERFPLILGRSLRL